MSSGEIQQVLFSPFSHCGASASPKVRSCFLTVGSINFRKLVFVFEWLSLVPRPSIGGCFEILTSFVEDFLICCYQVTKLLCSRYCFAISPSARSPRNLLGPLADLAISVFGKYKHCASWLPLSKDVPNLGHEKCLRVLAPLVTWTRRQEQLQKSTCRFWRLTALSMTRHSAVPWLLLWFAPLRWPSLTQLGVPIPSAPLGASLLSFSLFMGPFLKFHSVGTSLMRNFDIHFSQRWSRY